MAFLADAFHYIIRGMSLSTFKSKEIKYSICLYSWRYKTGKETAKSCCVTLHAEYKRKTFCSLRYCKTKYMRNVQKKINKGYVIWSMLKLSKKMQEKKRNCSLLLSNCLIKYTTMWPFLRHNKCCKVTLICIEDLRESCNTTCSK